MGPPGRPVRPRSDTTGRPATPGPAAGCRTRSGHDRWRWRTTGRPPCRSASAPFAARCSARPDDGVHLGDAEHFLVRRLAATAAKARPLRRAAVCMLPAALAAAATAPSFGRRGEQDPSASAAVTGSTSKTCDPAAVAGAAALGAARCRASWVLPARSNSSGSMPSRLHACVRSTVCTATEAADRTIRRTNRWAMTSESATTPPGTARTPMSIRRVIGGWARSWCAGS